MENLENARKTLKVLGIVCIVFGILGILGGLAGLLGGGVLAGGLAGSAGTLTADEADAAGLVTGLVLIVGVVILVSGLFTLLMGIFSVRGANDFSKIGAAWVFAVINLVLSIATIVLGLIAGGGFTAILDGLVGLVFAGVIFWAANTIKKAGTLPEAPAAPAAPAAPSAPAAPQSPAAPAAPAGTEKPEE